MNNGITAKRVRNIQIGDRIRVGKTMDLRQAYKGSCERIFNVDDITYHRDKRYGNRYALTDISTGEEALLKPDELLIVFSKR